MSPTINGKLGDSHIYCGCIASSSFSCLVEVNLCPIQVRDAGRSRIIEALDASCMCVFAASVSEAALAHNPLAELVAADLAICFALVSAPYLSVHLKPSSRNLDAQTTTLKLAALFRQRTQPPDQIALLSVRTSMAQCFNV